MRPRMKEKKWLFRVKENNKKIDMEKLTLVKLPHGIGSEWFETEFKIAKWSKKYDDENNPYIKKKNCPLNKSDEELDKEILDFML